MSRITDSARDERCTIQLPGCLLVPETVVFCHSNESIHGKGIGKKSHDIFGAYGCRSCHDIIDRKARLPKGIVMRDAKEYFHNGNARTVLILIAKGLVTCR